MSNYDISTESRSFKIFPENPKTGERRMVTIRRQSICLTHATTGEEIIFKKSKNGWRDSRDDSTNSHQFTVGEVARMLRCDFSHTHELLMSVVW